MSLHNRLKEYRAKLDINQQRGDYSPSVTLALKIAKECGASVEDIFWYVEDGNE